MIRVDQRTYGSVIADEHLRPLSREELERYHRNALVPQVGVVGQQRIRAARALLIGTGGLGSPAALYLAAAGVGAIGLIDDDDVDVTNLQRQVIHTSAAVGRPKVDSAAEAIRALNPDVEVITHRTRLSADNALGLLHGWDVVIDGTDNFPTRYLVNDASVMLGLPLVHGAVLGFDGQVGVFDARRGPCYRCLHPTPPPTGSVPSCAEAGVLGVLPGIIGTIQAAEALKLIIGGAEPLLGRLAVLDAWGARLREIPVAKNPACPVCGDDPSITELAAETASCTPSMRPGNAGVPDPEPSENDGACGEDGENSVSATGLRRLLESAEPPALLDVREDVEVALEPMEGALHIPLREVVARMDELDGSRPTVVVCAVGARSARAVEALKSAGYPGRLLSLEGGMKAWASG
ncbi:molybdopterin-synthase adenylyltransferase MoeB [Actinomyces viscosus]|uniref:Probable adenylyltransferase/sulfurtransferase MoeZ n=1 Tax=Actinomyces viscosus TaxID=1656 RepID=A0A3S4X9E5_ACTVI|nr:molybdopterin-synthase adenylyltransferase MoeB [Actinomyces viscosus]TFH52129.1 molybdopterin-synthase adenylyltransferase MoeB [Actinomyces viscosus]VEI15965.1 Probable adenylyltransferase/sulfurtransferase MoeZ [Actinomyces viscosus]